MSLYKPLEQLACALDLTQAQAKKLLKRGRIPFSKLSNKTILVKAEDGEKANMDNNIMKEDLMTIKQCAEFLQVSTATLYQWVYKRRIPYMRLGIRTVRFSRAQIEKWLSENSFQEF
jgi:excisionase family DNA binding protein